jgi:DNA-binding LacI/PurR family transcriptional regulator
VTSQDVAAAAGVSRATVSYVLNGVEHQRISAATRARVLGAAERLGYVPSAVASALRAGRTTIVVLAMPAWPLGPPVAEAVAAAVGELERLGYTALVHFVQPGDARAVARAFERVQPVGLIAPAGDLPPDRVDALRRNGTLAIVALARRPLPYVATLAFDQALVGRVVLEHLAERGHKRVLAVLPDGGPLADIAAERLAGAQKASGARLATLRSAPDVESIRAALAPRLEGSRPPTALYAFNDEFALAAIAALAELGLSVPGDLAVVGCDDSPAARHVRPRLTTVRLGTPDTWRRVARTVHDMVEGRSGQSVAGAPQLVVGDTS